MGRKPGRILVAFEDVEATSDLASALGVAEHEAVMHLERVLLADGQRIGLESTYLPRHRFGHFTETFDPTTSLYAAIRATGVRFGSAVERVETVLASPREAGLLESTTAMPMLRLYRRSLDTANRPIEVVRSLYRGDRVAFEALLTDRD
jgi:GntR family transcriptional regulator